MVMKTGFFLIITFKGYMTISKIYHALINIMKNSDILSSIITLQELNLISSSAWDETT